MNDWADDVVRVLKAEAIGVVATVPDAGLIGVLDRCERDPAIEVVTLTSEQEGIGLITGLRLGGKRGLLAMQSSGVGNCMNALSLVSATRTPCPMLITMRGQWGEFNPWQVPMGRGARPCLEAMGVHCFEVDQATEIGETLSAASQLAWHSGVATAVMVSQRVIGTKTFDEGEGCGCDEDQGCG